MQIALFAGLAATFYLIAAMRSAKIQNSAGSWQAGERVLFGSLLLAISFHFASLYPNVFSANGVNLGLYYAGSVVALCMTLVLSLITNWRPISSLSVVIYPIAGLLVILAVIFPSTRVVDQEVSAMIQLHIALSIIAYSLFAIATIQAVYLAIAEHRLKTHRPILHFLPPLPTMESMLFQLTAIAFALLSISLLLGFFSIESISLQHLAHKIAFSVLAWIVFAALIIGRWRFHWRGRRAIKYVCSGFLLLATAFFGTKVVLEMILQRV